MQPMILRLTESSSASSSGDIETGLSCCSRCQIEPGSISTMPAASSRPAQWSKDLPHPPTPPESSSQSGTPVGAVALENGP